MSDSKRLRSVDNINESEIINKLLTERYGVHNHTSLHKAVQENDLNSIEIILKKLPHLFNETDQLGQTPLHYAILYNGDFSTIQKMVEHSKDVINHADGYLGIPLIYVFFNTHKKYTIDDAIKIFELFVNNGADLRQSTKSLIAAALHKFKEADKHKLAELLCVLIKNRVDLEGKIPLLEDIIHETPEILRKEITENSLFFLEACKCSTIDQLKFYIQHDVNYNVVSGSGVTPLIIFLKAFDVEKALWFLSLPGVDPTVGKNGANECALEILLTSKLRNNDELLKMMLEKANAAGKYFAFSTYKHHPQYIALREGFPILLQRCFDYDYINILCKYEIIVTNEHIRTTTRHAFFDIFPFMRAGELNEFEFVLFCYVFDRPGENFDNYIKVLEMLLMNHNFPLDQVTVAHLLTITALCNKRDHHKLLHDLIYREAENRNINLEELKQISHRNTLNGFDWEYVNNVRIYGVIPDDLYMSIYSRYADLDGLARLHWFLPPFVLTTMLPSPTIDYAILFYSGFLSFARDCLAYIPIGTELFSTIFSRISRIMDSLASHQFIELNPQFGAFSNRRQFPVITETQARAQAAFASLNLRGSTSLQDMSIYYIRKNCNREVLGTTMPFASYLRSYALATLPDTLIESVINPGSVEED